MEEELNVTYLIFDGHVELQKYRYLYFVSFLVVYVLILCSNCTVVYLVWKHPDLHEPMYVFIAALLLNSVLFSTNIYPKLLLDVLADTQVITKPACLLQYFLFYSSVDSEFLLLAAMAYDRYVSICRPLHYGSVMTKRTVVTFLALAWSVPVCQFVALTVLCSKQKLCSFTLKVMFCNNSFYKLFCSSSAAISVFGVMTLLNDVILPVIFIVFSYVRILLICYRSSAAVRRKAAHTCLPHLLLIINYFFLISYDLIIIRLESDFAKTARLVMTVQLVLYNPLFNPIIYGLKMKEIHKHLKTLFILHKTNQR